MKLTIGTTTIDITSCEQCRDNKKGFYLYIKAPLESISMDNFYALLVNNKDTIVVVKDDGTENIYKGFGLLGKFVVENGQYDIAQYADSEIEAQLSVTQNKVALQEKALVSTNESVAAQAEHVMVLEESNMAQMATIDSLLLEILPSIVAEAVTTAVAEALASNSTTEESEVAE